MFKKLQNSVIDKKKLLSTNLNKRRVNKTPSKVIFPNRANLTFANIIVNMSSTPNISSIDNWNNSYFTTELNNSNSFSSKSKKNINLKDTIQSKDNHSKILSMVINGIIGLKLNDILNYCTKLIEIMVYIRDNFNNKNYIDISIELNKDLVMILYQTYFKIFNNDSIVYILLKRDLKNGMKIFQNVHFIYIFYILSGIIYLYYNKKSSNKNFYNFLKQFIKKEKCNDIKCILCNQIDLINFNFPNQIIFAQKPPVIKIVGKNTNKCNNLNNVFRLNQKFNKVFHIKQKGESCLINNSNDNIIRKRNINSKSKSNEKSFNQSIQKEKIEKIYCSHMVTNQKDKILDIKKYNYNIYDNKKKTFYSQIIKANEKEKNQFFNNSFYLKEKSNSKNKCHINNFDKNILYNSYNFYNSDKNYYNNNDKKYSTEINDKKSKRKINESKYSNLKDKIKIKLYKNNRPIKKAETNFDNKNKYVVKNENNNIKKSYELNKKEKKILSKNKQLKINKNNINISYIEQKVDKNISTNEKEINYNFNKSSTVIKENINAIEQEIKNFEKHNNYIK